MQFVDFTKESGYVLSFEAISEPRKGDVMLSIVVGRSKQASDLLIYPHPDNKVTTFQIDFRNYITYSVTYDDYIFWNDDEIFNGDIFRIYEKSHYLKRGQELKRRIATAVFFLGFYLRTFLIKILLYR